MRASDLGTYLYSIEGKVQFLFRSTVFCDIPKLLNSMKLFIIYFSLKILYNIANIKHCNHIYFVLIKSLKITHMTL